MKHQFFKMIKASFIFSVNGALQRLMSSMSTLEVKTTGAFARNHVSSMTAPIITLAYGNPVATERNAEQNYTSGRKGLLLVVGPDQEIFLTMP